MLLTVADRFGFSENELWYMPMSRLRFWYDGAVKIAKHERKQYGKA